jgi:HD-GYP domain-containing protein (c-di-GMP phosphodiesterase class II)
MVFMAGYDFNKDRVFGRIIGLADVFDSLSHWRIYKEKWETDQMIEFIAINAAYPDEPPA